jgi:hypothetical protein
MKNYIINANGVKTEVTSKFGNSFTLEELQEHVGGYIEIIRLTNKYLMVINEEGKILNLPFNSEATDIARQHKAIYQNDMIVGNALVAQESMID